MNHRYIVRSVGQLAFRLVLVVIVLAALLAVFA